jgi:hypothetical protein
MLPAWSLKVVASAITIASVLTAAGYVGGHLRNPRAPLQPKVIPLSQLSVSAGIQTSSDPSVTSTYES